jgi:hypothetical protein
MVETASGELVAWTLMSDRMISSREDPAAGDRADDAGAIPGTEAGMGGTESGNVGVELETSEV